MKRLAALICLLLVGLASAAPQEPQEPFRSGTELLSLDVTVSGADGAPVKGLAAEDFRVFVGGQPRKVVAADFLDFTTKPGAPAPVPAHYSANQELTTGRLIAVVVDEGNIQAGSGRSTVEAAARFLKSLAPADRIAVARIPAPGMVATFTTARDEAIKALGQAGGRQQRLLNVQAPNSCNPRGFNITITEAFDIRDGTALLQVAQRECLAVIGTESCENMEQCSSLVESHALSLANEVESRVERSVAALGNVLKWLAEFPEHKTVILLTEGWPALEQSDMFRQVSEVAAIANATIHVMGIDRAIADLSSNQPVQEKPEDINLRNVGVTTLASLTGGQVYRLAGDTSFNRLGARLGGRYRLGVELEPSDRASKGLSALKVEVNHPGASVQAHRQISVPASLTSGVRTRRLSAALAGIVVGNAVPFRLTTYSLRAPKPNLVRVLIAGDLMPADASSPTEVLIGVRDENGRGQSAGSTMATSRGGGRMSFVSSVDLEPGTYWFRAATIDSAGRLGVVERKVEVRLNRLDTLTASDLLVAAVQRPDEEIREPAVEVQAQGELLAGHLQVYSGRPDVLESLEVVLEIVEDLKPSTKPVRARRATRMPAEGETVAEFSGYLATTNIPTGDYFVRAVVAVKGKVIGDRARPVHIVESRLADAAPPTPAAGNVQAIVRKAVLQFEPETTLSAAVLNPYLDQLAAFYSQDATVGKAVATLKSGGFEQATRPDVSAARAEGFASFIRGVRLFREGSHNAAATEFRNVLRAVPDFDGATFFLGACFAAAGNDRGAAAVWQTLVIASNDPSGLLYLADARLRLGEGSAALEVMSELPQDAVVQERELRMALAHAATGEAEKAKLLLAGLTERDDVSWRVTLLAIALEIEEVGADPASPRRAAVEALIRKYVDKQWPHADLVQAWAKSAGVDR